MTTRLGGAPKGVKKTAAHKAKIAKAQDGKANSNYKDGRRNYRKTAGATENDGSVVHHKSGRRTGKGANEKSNLQRLNDPPKSGSKTVARKTTPKHEAITKRAKK